LSDVVLIAVIDAAGAALTGEHWQRVKKGSKLGGKTQAVHAVKEIDRTGASKGKAMAAQTRNLYQALMDKDNKPTDVGKDGNEADMVDEQRNSTMTHRNATGTQGRGSTTMEEAEEDTNQWVEVDDTIKGEARVLR
jgi:hypothetical protein